MYVKFFIIKVLAIIDDFPGMMVDPEYLKSVGFPKVSIRLNV